MEITEISVVSVKPDRRTRFRGYAFVVLDNCLKISNIRIIEGEEGIFIAMPSLERKRRCKSCGHKISYKSRFCENCGAENAVILTAVKYKDMVFAVDKSFSEKLRKAIVDKYNEVVKQGEKQNK